MRQYVVVIELGRNGWTVGPFLDWDAASTIARVFEDPVRPGVRAWVEPLLGFDDASKLIALALSER